MLSDKKQKPDFRQNPGVIIGKEEMTKFIDFVENMFPKEQSAEPKIIKLS